MLENQAMWEIQTALDAIRRLVGIIETMEEHDVRGCYVAFGTLRVVESLLLSLLRLLHTLSLL